MTWWMGVSKQGSEYLNREIDVMGYDNPDMPGVIEGLKKFHAVAVNHEYDFIPSL